MQVQKIGNNDISFGAKLKVVGSKIDEKAMKKLSDKANEIGLENDVIEIRFSHLFSVFDRNGYYSAQKKCYINNMYNVFKQIFNARFLPNGNVPVTHPNEGNFITKYYEDISNHQEQVVNNYLDKLITR